MARTIAEELQQLRELTSNGGARAIRESARLSQADVALSVQTDPSTIARWERGERLPRGDAAVRYARLLARLAKATTAA